MITVSVNHYERIFKDENIHPSYYQYLAPPEPEIKSISHGYPVHQSSWGRSLAYVGVFLSGALFTLIAISGPPPSSASVPSPEIVRVPIVERIRAQRHRHLRRVKEVEHNIQNITKVLTYLHGAITEAVGEPVPADTHEQDESSSADLPTVTVIVPKANLRAAPDIDSKAIAAVSEGTQLVIDTAAGEWFGVTAPSGERAWIRKDLASFL